MVSANRGIYAEGDGRNNIVIDKCNVTAATSNGYAVYIQEGSTATISNSTFASDSQTTIQSITAAKELKSTVTLTNVTATAGAAYTVAVNPNNTYYIDGGSFRTTGSKDAAINVVGYGAYMKVTGDTYVECGKNCPIRVYYSNADYSADGIPVLDIEGGTFVYTAQLDNGGGSALRSGTGSAGGITNIKGGTFISYGTAAVINGVHADATLNITGGTFENKGDTVVPVVEHTANPNFVTVNFPEGVKKVEYKNGEFVDPDAVQPEDTTVTTPEEETTVPTPEDETTVPTPEDTTVPTPEDTTVPTPEDTTVPTPEDTTVPTPEDTTVPTPEDTTKAPDVSESEKPTDSTDKPADTSAPSVDEPDGPVVGDAIGTIVIIAAIALVTIAGVVAFVVIKKKENN